MDDSTLRAEVGRDVSAVTRDYKVGRGSSVYIKDLCGGRLPLWRRAAEAPVGTAASAVVATAASTDHLLRDREGVKLKRDARTGASLSLWAETPLRPGVRSRPGAVRRSCLRSHEAAAALTETCGWRPNVVSAGAPWHPLTRTRAWTRSRGAADGGRGNGIARRGARPSSRSRSSPCSWRGPSPSSPACS